MAQLIHGLYDPKDDAVTHVNIFSGAETQLGVLLSNFTKTPFVHPKHGKFDSMEGYYYFVSTGEIDDLFKSLPATEAKKYGKSLHRCQDPLFEEKMRFGLRLKVSQNKHILDALTHSTLPFTHYYNFKGKIHIPEGNDWLVDEYTKIRDEIKRGVFNVNAA